MTVVLQKTVEGSTEVQAKILAQYEKLLSKSFDENETPLEKLTSPLTQNILENIYVARELSFVFFSLRMIWLLGSYEEFESKDKVSSHWPACEIAFQTDTKSLPEACHQEEISITGFDF